MATPGHTANHMAFAWRERKILFIGDHVMGWSTSIVSPPDGSMIDYMASLQKLTQRDENLYFSGHGPEIPDAMRYVHFLLRHRKAREDSILHRLAKGEADIPTMVRASYIGIDPRLTGAAGYSVLAHLEDLVGARDRCDRWRSGDRRELSVGVNSRHSGMRHLAQTRNQQRIRIFWIPGSRFARPGMTVTYFFATPFAAGPWPAQPASSAQEFCPRRC